MDSRNKVRLRWWRCDVKKRIIRQMSPTKRQTAGDAASVVSIASTQHDAGGVQDDGAETQDLYDLQVLEVLEQELKHVQSLKSDTQAHMELLLDEQRTLELMERREKAQEAKNASQFSRMDRIQQLQEQERIRREELAATRKREEQERLAKTEEARRKQAHSIQTHDDQDLDNLDAFLAQESSYF